MRFLAVAAVLLLGGCAPLAAVGAAVGGCLVYPPCAEAALNFGSEALTLDDDALKIWNERHPVVVPQP